MRFAGEGYHHVRRQIGEGPLVGKVRVDQVYAKYQHERMDLAHPHGGGAKYLQRPLYERSGSFLRRIATEALNAGPRHGMISIMESLAGGMSAAAPVELNNLRRSANPKVFDNGALVYNRPAQQPRLSDPQLRALRRGRRRRR